MQGSLTKSGQYRGAALSIWETIIALDTMPAIPSSPEFPDLVEMLAALGPGDLSVNEAAAAQPGAAMLTRAGSPNDLLWSKMEAAGGASIVALPDPAAPDARAFRFTERGAHAVAAAVRVLLARKADAAPVPSPDATELMAPLVAQRATVVAARKELADQIARLETIAPKTAEHQALQAGLLSDTRPLLQILDAGIAAINDAIAAGPTSFGVAFVERAKLILETGSRMKRSIIEKQHRA